MSVNKKKIKVIIISIISVLVITTAIVVGVSIFRYYHPTHYKYNDKFILGNTMENIIERYGEFDRVREGKNTITGEYLVKEGGWEVDVLGLSAPIWPVYYQIVFEDGKAVRVSLFEDGIGG